jgi:hypothetical protein
MAPTEAWGGAPGLGAAKYRPTGTIANAASAQAGPATEAANNRADSGSDRSASAATEITPAIAPASSPKPRVAIMIGNGAR